MSISAIILIILYAIYKTSVLIDQNEAFIQTVNIEDHFPEDYIYSSDDGIDFAFRILTPDSQEDVTNKFKGEIKAFKQDSTKGTHIDKQVPLLTSICSKNDFGNGTTNSTVRFPIQLT